MTENSGEPSYGEMMLGYVPYIAAAGLFCFLANAALWSLDFRATAGGIVSGVVSACCLALHWRLDARDSPQKISTMFASLFWMSFSRVLFRVEDDFLVQFFAAMFAVEFSLLTVFRRLVLFFVRIEGVSEHSTGRG